MPERRRSRVPIALLCAILALFAVALAAAWGAGLGPSRAAAPPPGLHRQAVETVDVISPHLPYAGESALVPQGHYFGVLAGSVTTCGTEGVNLTPQEMARHPVRVTLWHEGVRIASVRLARRSGFAFLVVGGRVVRFPYDHRTHEQPSGWSPGFTITTSNGFAGSAQLGGIPGVGEVVFQIPARPHVLPCYPDRPSIPDLNRVPIRQVCVELSASIDGQVSPATGEQAVVVTLTNEGSRSCQLFGYPGIALADRSRQLPSGTVVPSPRGILPFTIVHRSQYTSNFPPRVVTLPPGGRAYVEVTKYRCDGRELRLATVLALRVPVGGQLLTLALPRGGGDTVLSYCQGGARSPGDLVAVSPITGSARALDPR